MSYYYCCLNNRSYIVLPNVYFVLFEKNYTNQPTTTPTLGKQDSRKMGKNQEIRTPRIRKIRKNK